MVSGSIAYVDVLRVKKRTLQSARQDLSRSRHSTSSLVSAQKCRTLFPVLRCGEGDGEPRNRGAQVAWPEPHPSIKHHARQSDLQFMQRGNYLPSSPNIHARDIQSDIAIQPSPQKSPSNLLKSIPKHQLPTSPAAEEQCSDFGSDSSTNPFPWLSLEPRVSLLQPYLRHSQFHIMCMHFLRNPNPLPHPSTFSSQSSSSLFGTTCIRLASP